MRPIIWIALAIAVAYPAAAQAPATADRLQIGVVELTVGMEEKPAIAALRRHYRVERARSAGDDWGVIEGTRTIGVVSFSAEKLSHAAKTWYNTSGRDAAALADQLYALAAQFAAQGRTQCALSAKPYKAGTTEGRILTLACGAKSIQIAQSRLRQGGSATSVQEVLQ